MKTEQEIREYLASLVLNRDCMLEEDEPDEEDFKILSSVIDSVQYILENEHPRLVMRPISLTKILQEAKNTESDQQES